MYVKITNGTVSQYPYTTGHLRRDNPNTSFPKTISVSTLNDWDVYEVSILDEPAYDPLTQNLQQEETPSLVGGVWTLGYTVTDKTAEEIEQGNAVRAEMNRQKRDELIAATDWWASSDLTMTAEQTAYRQALRDITAHANWPHLEEADWPVKP